MYILIKGNDKYNWTLLFFLLSKNSNLIILQMTQSEKEQYTLKNPYRTTTPLLETTYLQILASGKWRCTCTLILHRKRLDWFRRRKAVDVYDWYENITWWLNKGKKAYISVLKICSICFCSDRYTEIKNMNYQFVAIEK